MHRPEGLESRALDEHLTTMAPPPRSIPFVPYQPPGSPEAEARAFYERLNLRRSVRFFSDRPVSEEAIRWCIAAGGTAPSGANKQPWRFVAVSNPELKRKIRDAAEIEEREFYERRATPEWLADLAPLGTDAEKEFLEVAPWLIVVFKLMKTDPEPDGTLPSLSREQEETPRQGKVYYVDESVGIACGMLISAIHHAGLVTLTHTPSPMGFLTKVLGRPDHERAFLLLPVGYPAPGCPVPDIHRKPLDQIAVWVR
jgi:iodotyrosine deiodinase